ncbi:uncharacterized protein LOC123405030 [Hordeum vulgare subsp. vulgare]|uniref:uncharacterized protein LOC123405030 n=1 Tax=Hordeum vulgare subsp. vulgare TaxID=112509 RepID=UPI000B46069E|nr:uncharacterized protein LOC123405030 [Hordeum vulgare subsp. vulgare]
MLQLGRRLAYHGLRLAYHGLRPRLVTTCHLLATVPPPLPPSASLPSPTASTMAAWQPCAVDVVYGEVYAGCVGLPVVDGSALRGVLSVDLGPEDVPSFVAAPESYCVFDGLEDADDVFVNSFHELETKSEVLAPAVKGTSNVLKACSAMKVQKILLFAVAKESSNFLPILKETAKSFKGKLLFVFVEGDNEEVGEPVANYFGITGQETTVLAYTGNEDAKKFFFSGEISLDNIKVAGDDGNVG